MIAGSFRAPLQAREYIPERRNVRTRIIFEPGMHLWLKKCPDKDYFGTGGCIPERRNVRIRIILGPVDASLNGEMSG